jgi:uncharacterized protein (DUF1800 family)
MQRLGFALGVAALLATTGSLSATATDRFGQKLSKQKQAVHVLNRLTFGPRPGDVDRVRRVGVEAWIRLQLQPERVAENAALESRLRSLETLQLPSWRILEKYQPAPPFVPVVRTPLGQLLAADQVQTLLTGTPEQRLAVVSSVAPENLKLLLPSLSPLMLQGLPELQKQVQNARQAEQQARQVEIRRLNPPLSELLSADQRRVTQQGTADEKRALLMSFDPEKRRQILRILPAATVADIPELRRESLAARQPQQFVTQESIDGRLYRALYSNRQLEEVLVDFWLNHFNVFSGKGPIRLLLPSYERDAIRPHVLGRFRDLLLATARHPAMLFYLDNWQSAAPRDDIPPPPVPVPVRRPGLNENYARELMELHTLGVDGGYTQDDVIAVARSFTGWTIYDVSKVGEFQFNPGIHDRKEKIVLGHTIAAGGGEQDGLQVIDILSRHPSTATFISRKLAQRFVADAPPQQLVDRMAATFTRTDGDLRAVLETMFLSREFLSEGAWQTKLKSPLELVLSAVRALDADVTDTMALSQRIAELGQPLYGKAEPTGYPNTGEAWTSSAGFLGRINVANALLTGGIDGVAVDATRLPREPGVAAARLLGTAPSPATRSVLEKGLAGKDISPSSVAAVVLASPDFQRR